MGPTLGGLLVIVVVVVVVVLFWGKIVISFLPILIIIGKLFGYEFSFELLEISFSDPSQLISRPSCA